MAGLGRSRPLTTRGAAEVRVMRRMRRAGGDSPLARAEGDSDPVRRRTIALAMLGPHQSQPAMSQAPRPATAGGTLALCLGRRCQARPPCMDSMGQFCRPCRGLMGSGLRLGTVILHLHILTSATSATGCQCLLGQPRPCLIRRGRHLILRWVQRRRLLRRLEALMRAARAAEDEKKGGPEIGQEGAEAIAGEGKPMSTQSPKDDDAADALQRPPPNQRRRAQRRKRAWGLLWRAWPLASGRWRRAWATAKAIRRREAARAAGCEVGGRRSPRRQA